MPAPRSGCAVLVVDPELQRRPALHAVGPVLGREQRLGDLDRGAVGVAEDRDDLLVAVVAGARGPHRAQRQQAAVGEDDADRAPQRRVLAHARSSPRQPIFARDEPSDDPHADPERDAAACAAIYAPHVEDGADLLRGAGARRGGDRRPDRAPRSDPPLARRRGARARWSASPTPARTARGPPTAGRSTSPSTSPPAIRARDTAAASTRPSSSDLRERGFRVACAGITLPNEASVALHESLGFEPVGVYRGIGWKAGAWRDVGWWQLELSPGAEDPPAEPR